MRKYTSFVAALMVSAGAASAAVVVNFEPPTYTAGQDINSGQDGWVRFGSVNGRVTPDTNSGYVPPTYPILEGTQSFVLYTNGGGYGHTWGAAGAAEVADGAVVSWLMRTEVNTGASGPEVYLSDNVAGGSTPAGLVFDEASSQIKLNGAGSNTNSGFSYTFFTNYKLEMELDFTLDQYTAYATDLTNGGARTLLGTKPFYMGLDASNVAATGGLFFGKYGGSAYFIDDVQMNVPEPAALSLVGLAALGMLGRKRRSV